MPFGSRAYAQAHTAGGESHPAPSNYSIPTYYTAIYGNMQPITHGMLKLAEHLAYLLVDDNVSMLITRCRCHINDHQILSPKIVD